MSGDKGQAKAYADRIIARARELKGSDAFALAFNQVGTRISAAQAKATTAMHGRNTRRIVISFVLAMIIVAAISLCLPYYGINVTSNGGGLFTPDKVFAAYALWFQMNVLPLFTGATSGETAQMLSDFSATYGTGTYTLIINRLVVTVIVVLCGIALAVSGMLFQTSFRNPLATPTMLGVSDGVTLGSIVYCLIGYINIADNANLYVVLVYGCGALAVAFVLFASRFLSGGKRYNVLDMLLLGTVLCQLVGGVNQYIQYFVMSDSTWENFFEVQQASNALTVPLLQGITVVFSLITIAIVVVLRFKFNLISYSDDEGTMMGVRAGLLRGVALVVGSAMQLVALASVGQVAMVSLAVPFLARFLMPADFRSQFLGNCLIGPLFLLICMVVQHFVLIGTVMLPLGTIVSLIIVPFFVWVVAFSQGGWK